MSGIEDRRSTRRAGIVQRIGIGVILAAVAHAILLLPGYAAAADVSETFDTFSCPGAWQPAVGGVNSSYVRDCGNGWTAYAQDSIAPGGIGNLNNVALDATVNGPSAPSPTPLASALINTAPGDPPRGILWLLKSYPVESGVPIQTIQADFRLKLNGTLRARYGLIVFDGLVTDPSGPTTQLADSTFVMGDPSLVNDTCYGLTVGQWCAWQTVNAGGKYIVPTTSYITIGFKLEDVRDTQTAFAELDNLTVSGVITTADPTLPAADIAQFWNQTYQASGTDNMAESADIAVDSAGNSYVAGSSYNSLNYDIVTIKYDDTGTPVWTGGASVYDGGSGDQAVAIALGPSGNVYVIGRSHNASDNDDYVVLKYDTAGTLLWHVNYDNLGRDDVPTGLAVNSSGVYVTGSSCGAASACDYATIKLDPATGSQQWAMTYNGSTTMDILDKAVGVKLDGAGNVYVTGRSYGNGDDIVTIKYNSSGVQQWESRYDSGWDERATAMAVDSAGNSYIAGLTYRGGAPSILALKYDTNGTQLWATDYSGSTSETLPSAVAIDGSGNVYITGKTGRVLDHDIVTVKLLSDGSIAWGRTYGNPGFDDWGVDIGVDAAGKVFVVGAITRGTGNTDIVTVKYDAGGTPLSSIAYDGFTLMDTPAAVALGVDAQGDTVPYVTGKSFNLGGLSEISTVRYIKSGPDLTVSAASGPTTGMIGGSITIDSTVLNIDDLAGKKHVDSGAFDISFYLGSAVSGIPDLNNLILLGSRSVSNLAPGESSAASTSLTIPTTVAEGSYYMVIIADSGGAVAERDETNNIMTLPAEITIAGTLPDLAVTALSGPGSITRDVPFNVSTTVSNLASTAAASFRVGIYLSTDATVTASDILIGSRTIASLSGFSTDTATTSVTVPSATVPSGTYYLGAIADDQAAVTESNESNNSAVLGGTSNSTLLTTDTDFLAGLPGTNVVVAGTGNAGHVILASIVAWTAQSAWNVPDVGSRSAPALADLNGDGLLDLVVGSNSGTTYGYKNTGTAANPAWTAEPTWDMAPPASCSGLTGAANTTFSQPAIGDMNGDGVPDLLLRGYRYGICGYQITVTSTGPTWTPVSTWDVPGSSPTLANKFNAPALADLNGDGKLDLLVGQNTGTVLAYLNTGTTTSPVWTYTSTLNYTSGLSYPRPNLVDLDGDGKVDLMLGNSVGTVIGIQNTGTVTAPVWTANSAWDVPDSGAYSSPAFADLDGNGRVDLVNGDNSGVSFGFLNSGSYIANTVPPPDGIYTSKVVDAGTHGGFTTLSYVTVEPAGTSISVDVRASDDASTWTIWYTGIASGGDISVLGTHRYVQYRVNLVSTDGNVTPELYSIQANTSPAPATSTPVAVVVGSGGAGGGGELGIIELLFLSLAGLLGVSHRRRVRI